MEREPSGSASGSASMDEASARGDLETGEQGEDAGGGGSQEAGSPAKGRTCLH